MSCRVPNKRSQENVRSEPLLPRGAETYSEQSKAEKPGEAISEIIFPKSTSKCRVPERTQENVRSELLFRSEKVWARAKN